MAQKSSLPGHPSRTPPLRKTLTVFKREQWAETTQLLNWYRPINSVSTNQKSFSKLKLLIGLTSVWPKSYCQINDSQRKGGAFQASRTATLHLSPPFNQTSLLGINHKCNEVSSEYIARGSSEESHARVVIKKPKFHSEQICKREVKRGRKHQTTGSEICHLGLRVILSCLLPARSTAARPKFTFCKGNVHLAAPQNSSYSYPVLSDH